MGNFTRYISGGRKMIPEESLKCEKGEWKKKTANLQLKFLKCTKWSGNPLQNSCLENSMDRAAWWATFCRVAKRWTKQSGWACTQAPNEHHQYHVMNETGATGK